MKKPEYGLDAPGIVRGFLFGGPALFAVGYFLIPWAKAHFAPLIGLGYAAFYTGIVLFIESFLLMGSSYYGKFRARDKLLDSLNLRGDETVLDVGCGHGLLLIAAAKRLPGGRSVGIDLWSQVDQGNNSREATLQNAKLEGVADRVEVRDGDMRKLPFPDASVDAVVANLAIHNISDRQGRRQAIAEIVRVLKPGGQVALMDFKHVGQYAEDLKKNGMSDARASGRIFWIFPPVRVARGRKV
ncbi:MAG TPA: class I SAM-dependent methyltransferase [Candidatus Acidoferrales bacterium]|nr:class I SAM-dependent methyltransferase [Candidatus Acidoferrales bacterium]